MQGEIDHNISRSVASETPHSITTNAKVYVVICPPPLIAELSLYTGLKAGWPACMQMFPDISPCTHTIFLHRTNIAYVFLTHAEMKARQMHTNTRIMQPYTHSTYAAFGLLFGAFLAASVEHGGLLLGNQRLAKLNRAGEVQKYVSGNLSRSSRRLRTALHGTRGHTFLASESRMRTHVHGTCTPGSTVRACSHVCSSSLSSAAPERHHTI